MARQYGVDPDEKQAPRDQFIDRKDDEAPSAEEVIKFHKFADVDSKPEAMHHTLGPSGNQAAPGNHTHNGQDSPLLLEGMIMVGDKNANPPAAVLNSIIQAMVRLGARDNTT